jgi:protease I
MPHDLNGRTIAILATDGFEQSELTEPKRALEEAGATVHVIAPKSGTIRGWDKTDWGEEVAVDLDLEHARPREL